MLGHWDDLPEWRPSPLRKPFQSRTDRLAPVQRSPAGHQRQSGFRSAYIPTDFPPLRGPPARASSQLPESRAYRSAGDAGKKTFAGPIREQAADITRKIFGSKV